MRIERLSLRRFRNIDALDIEPSPRFNVIVGPNGHGKTNTVEAVYFLSALKSFRGLRNDALVQEGSAEATCAAEVERAGVRRTLEVRVTPRGRRVALNGKPIRKLTELFGSVNVVAFCPEDIGALRSGPSERRAVLDRMIFHATPAYAEEAARYEVALRNRNALLKQGVDGGMVDPALLDIYDGQVAELGARLVERRVAYLRRFASPFSAVFDEIFGPCFDPSLSYHFGALTDEAARELSPDVIRGHLAVALERARPRDRTRGTTSVGPHRDDIVAALQGRPLATYGSQGQHRAFVLSMKIAEILQIHAQTGSFPILVLDDVSSELDAVRNEQLFAFLASIDGQVFLTTTDERHIRLSGALDRWHVERGRVTRVAHAAVGLEPTHGEL